MSTTKCTWHAAARREWKILCQFIIKAHRRPFPLFFRPVRRFIKRLVHPISTPTPALRSTHYAAERQFSFNDTPTFHLKLHRRPTSASALFHLPRFSCINPEVEFDSELGRCVVDYDDNGDWDCQRLCGGGGGGGACTFEGDEEDGIDLKAEKFIKMFYEEMKMQSRVSFLQFDEFSDADE